MMIKFRLQVYYCCWEELMKETTAKYFPCEVELEFFGNSRHHHEDCPVYLEILRRNEKQTGIGVYTEHLQRPHSGIDGM